MTRSTIRDCTIEWGRSGDGIDVVWGHGLTQSRALEDRRQLIDWANTDARVVRYDARGHGASESTPGLDGYGWDQLALDQLALADVIGLDRYVAAGASMGAATALHAAVLEPERIEGLVLAIPPTGWETRQAQAELYEQGADLVEQHGVEPLIRAGAALPPPDPFLGDDEYAARRADGLRSWDPARLALAMRGAAHAQMPSREAIAEIACPVLVLAWSGDGGHPVSTADELRRLLREVDVQIASTADELSTWTNQVADFVRQL
jgi:pimeloyl-ACP methyl ester carboxylesterase